MKHIISILIIVAVIGCSSSDNLIHISKDYEDLKVDDTDLVIVKLFDKPIIKNAEDINDALGEGNAEDLYLSYFNSQFPQCVKNFGSFNKVFYMKDISKVTFKERILEFNLNESIGMMLPIDGTTISNNNIIADYILFVDSLKSITSSGQVNVIGTIATSSFPSIIQNLNFLIWDNRSGQVVSYGKIQEDHEFGGKVYKEYLDTILSSITKNIIKCSPFVSLTN
jgi:hypothetical protein